MKLIIQSKSYAVSMTLRQFRNLSLMDYDQVRSWFSDLESNMDNIEYNGHFGANFFFRLSHEKESIMDADAQRVIPILLQNL